MEKLGLPVRKRSQIDYTIEIHGSNGSCSSSSRLNELKLLRESDWSYTTILITDENDLRLPPYPPGHVIGWEHTSVHNNCKFLNAVGAGQAFEPGFQDDLTA
ncbi:hypothetical protein OB919_20590 [Halobacteria archaeon AArc-curdl1]|uniref:Uncharacterized protein n=1 Tax=Natronosalvus hydrolyticus TaxID=2979988 RepID=A0AAP3E8W1_9EURY|nr:hypothetical protein [Halobacteria archaeon AArc-curdl1]